MWWASLLFPVLSVVYYSNVCNVITVQTVLLVKQSHYNLEKTISYE